MSWKAAIIEKLKEALSSVLPIFMIVLAICCFFVPLDTGLLLSFIIGSAMLVAGMGFFTIGSDASMTQIGSHIGAYITKTRKLRLILPISLLLGAAITVAEPDLQVLANSVPTINTSLLVAVVSVGVGFFLVLCMLRILFKIPLRWLLLLFYAGIFGLSALIDPDFICVAFDSGGVTTGPMTVPFIMALGVGVASARSDGNAKQDGFGLVALCSVGPILAVMLLGLLYGGKSGSAGIDVAVYSDTVAMGFGYLRAIPHYLKEVAVALLPIFLAFLLFQIFALRMNKTRFVRILLGVLFTFVGLILFLTGVNVGFSSLGYVLGQEIAVSPARWLLIPLVMLMGWFVIRAEPAIHVLNKQVEELSAGAISARSMGLSLSIAIALANGFAMIRVLTGISIFWFLIPGYAIALLLSFFVPQTFTSIAFDSGGVASGPMTATFMLPFVIGVCNAVGGSIMTDAFGIVAMVAMMPLITIQIMGAIAVIRRRDERAEIAASIDIDDEIVELWEEM